MKAQRKTSTSRLGSIIAGLAVAGAATLGVGAATPVASAVEPATVAAGAAAAAVVLKAVEGLVSWVNDQSGDCYAAALGAAWGADCNLDKDEEQDTGWSTVFVKATGDNNCARGHGQALAQESLIGSWASQTVKPWVIAWTKPLHHHTEEDFHKGRGWAKAGVDNHAKAKTVETPGDPTRPRSTAASVASKWVAGDVVAEVRVDSLDLKTANRGGSGGSTTTWRIQAWIDGGLIFSSTGEMDQQGNVTVEGDMDAGLFTPLYNPVDNVWEISISDYSTEVFITHLDPTDEVDLTVKLEAELESQDWEFNVFGDVNGDGVVNILDLLGVRNHLGESAFSPPENQAYDLNWDGMINVLDMIQVRNCLGNSYVQPPDYRELE